MSKQPRKQYPSSKESEMLVLGCMLNNIDGLNYGVAALEADDFLHTNHKEIFEVLKWCFLTDRKADVHVVAEELKRQGRLTDGTVPYLISLSQFAGVSTHIDEYCKVVKDKAILRKIIIASQAIQDEAFNDPSDVEEALDEAQQKLFKISQATSRHKGVSVKDILSGSINEKGLSCKASLQERITSYKTYGSQNGITGIETHFKDLDKMIDGFNNSNLMILAARPAMGKTALAINIAENICFKNNLPVGIFSLEMTAEQLLHRMLCSQAEVDSKDIKQGSINDAQFERISKVVDKMSASTMIIDDEPNLKVSDLRVRARRMKEAHDIKFLVIDYLQLLSGSGSKRSQENRALEIGEISRTLKGLARELNIPILCLSQLSRKVEERPSHRPMMSDLKESGSIEQDSDLVMFLFRKEYYDKFDKPGTAQLIIAKNRHGEIGELDLAFKKEFAKFENREPFNWSNASY